MKKSLFILVMVLSLSLNLGFWGMIAWQHKPCPPKDRFHPFYRERFGLSFEKAKKMEGLRKEMMQKMKPTGQELAKERKELIHLLSVPEPNRAEIDQRLANIQALQGSIHLMLVEHMLSAKENLTPAQQKRFFKFIMGRMDSHRPGQGRRGPKMEKRGGKYKQKTE
ncbi:periplasmic heavy metal sensor [bacterium]|nr:periplasmic heavy metal sensor [bacterium]MBU1614068.1 periplasmic heavy metal sensor [bacterium]